MLLHYNWYCAKQVNADIISGLNPGQMIERNTRVFLQPLKTSTKKHMSRSRICHARASWQLFLAVWLVDSVDLFAYYALIGQLRLLIT